MSIAIMLEEFLEEQGIQYDLIQHEPTMSTGRTAEATHISGNRLAKGVLLKDGRGYVLAVLPATHHIRMADLEAQTNRRLSMACEKDMTLNFPDCERGAVPIVGEPYGLEMIVDDSIVAQPEVYFEGGDHQTLIHVSGAQFQKLTAQARHGRFSTHD